MTVVIYIAVNGTTCTGVEEVKSMLVQLSPPCCRLAQRRWCPGQRSQFDFLTVAIAVALLHSPASPGTSVLGKCPWTRSLAYPYTNAEHAHDAVIEKNDGGKDAETYRHVWGWMDDLCS